MSLLLASIHLRRFTVQDAQSAFRQRMHFFLTRQAQDTKFSAETTHSKAKKTPRSVEITALLVRLPGLEPGASGLGEQITLCPTIPLHYIPLRFVSI